MDAMGQDGKMPKYTTPRWVQVWFLGRSRDNWKQRYMELKADAKRLQSAIGSPCKVEISGLSNRVSWQRSDISELTLYIPYQVQLTGCQ